MCSGFARLWFVFTCVRLRVCACVCFVFVCAFRALPFLRALLVPCLCECIRVCVLCVLPVSLASYGFLALFHCVVSVCVCLMYVRVAVAFVLLKCLCAACHCVCCCS